MASADAKRRVKLYALNANKQWDDKGTGHVTSCYHEPLDGMSLLVRNESDGSLLLESKIQLDTQYQKQQKTLIVWNESDNYDLALSFQEQDGCNEIWEKICHVQGKDPHEQNDDDEQEELRINLVECDQDKLQLILEQITAFSQTTRRRDVLASEYIENDYIQKLLHLFREAEERQDITTLHRLYEIFKQLFLYDRPTLTEIMLSEQYLLDIIGVFEYEPPPQDQLELQTSIENEEDRDGDGIELKEEGEEDELQNETNDGEKDNNEEEVRPEMAKEETKDEEKIDKSIEDNNEEKVEDENKTPVSESDSVHDQNIDNTDQQQQQQHEQQQQNVSPKIIRRKRHREFLENGTTFKEVIPFSDQKLVDKIHQTYRVQYLQSSVLPSPSILEENAYASLTNILFFSKVEIVSMIQENRDFLQNLFNQIISNETGVERKRELVLFLREYCIFSQTIQPKQREIFFKVLASLKILSAVEVALSSNDQVIKSAAIDIFTYLVEYNPHMTREHAVKQKEGKIDPPNRNIQTANILKLVIEHITTDEDPELGTATQLSCIMRLLLDPENMSGDGISKHSFLEFFYCTCMQSLVEPINKSTTPDGDIEPSANDRKTAQLLSIMLELVTFFIEHHYSQLRNYIVSSDLLTRIISLIKSRHKFLALSVVRFFRRLIATKDDIYYELIMNEDLFSPIVQVLKNNNGRYNLLDSAILEMFEYIQSEELYTLMNHILTNFGIFLESIDYVNTFKVMRHKRDTFTDIINDKTCKSRIENSRVLFGPAYSRREVNDLWLDVMEGDEDEANIRETSPEPERDLDPDSGDATVDSDSDGLNLPDLEFSTNGNRNEDDDVDEEEDVEAEDEDDIQMDEEDCDDELEPLSKKKKTK